MSDCMWLRATESPTKAMDLPRTRRRKAAASKRGRSQPWGCHRHRRMESIPGLPYFMQSCRASISGHVALV
ncbi:hypothetical protein CFC21_093489 [Triticum aestivum]|uniref:Uncharacterized protein n=2 Tax=Triticum aestivum TaxID=4565 RepID=A0A3B6QHL1_WHEAT|nr:hypothetical protein CFC21_093489 [Triticum aestivum]